MRSGTRVRGAGLLEVLELLRDLRSYDAHVAQLHYGAGKRLAVADGREEASDCVPHLLYRLTRGGGGVAKHLEGLLVAENAVRHHHQRTRRGGELVEREGGRVAKSLQVGHVRLGLVDVAD